MPDFNGDGRDDILWWNQEAGTFSNWLGREDGGFQINDANALTFLGQGPDLDWEMIGIGDFDGDDHDDILWLSDDGDLSNWLGTDSGGFIVNDVNALVHTGIGFWAIGDFDGDGRDDLLSYGFSILSGFSTSIRFGTETGGFTAPVGSTGGDPTPWGVIGVGDFNGDGRDDLLWRNVMTGAVSNWLANDSGGFAVNDANAWHDVPNQWQVVGIGDFNGDGRDDILWSNQTNLISNWLGTEAGGFIINDANALATDPTEWWVVGVGDYNGDGRDDILWREGGGAISNWLGTEAGGWIVNDAAAYAQVEVSWDTSLAGDSHEWWD